MGLAVVREDMTMNDDKGNHAAWSVKKGGEFLRYMVVSEHGAPIAKCNDEDTARLIAAAPETAAERDRLQAINAELVTALEAILPWLETDVEYAGSDAAGLLLDAIQQARAVVAKAKGD